MSQERSDEQILLRLHLGLRERRPPQDVVVDLVALRADRWLSAVGTRDLYAMFRHELSHRGGAATKVYAAEPLAGEPFAAEPFAVGPFAVGASMPKVWRHHPGLTRAYAAAESAVAAVAGAAGQDAPAAADPADPRSLSDWLAAALALLGLSTDEPWPARPTMPRKTVVVTWRQWSMHRLPKPKGARGDHGGHADARDRMDAATRRELLPGVSVRAYRRAVRSVLHLQRRTTVLAEERDREAAVAFGKARLAYLVEEEEFLACPATAAFTAYYVARLNLRTVFTSGSQARPMDTLAAELLNAALAAPTCRPWVLASVLTQWRILDQLDDTQCGLLMGRYYEHLAASARALRRCFDPLRDRTAMITRMGDDSSTWNSASRAFNQARTGWLNLLRGLGYDDALEASCPGKVPALVAADVAAWHRLEGREQHVDVRVWADLPLPWDVVLGDDECPADLVREACLRRGVDPEADGWTQPYRQGFLALPAPAPDLVHGVVVTSPLLAGVLRRHGVFSGQA